MKKTILLILTITISLLSFSQKAEVSSVKKYTIPKIKAGNDFYYFLEGNNKRVYINYLQQKFKNSSGFYRKKFDLKIFDVDKLEEEKTSQLDIYWNNIKGKKNKIDHRGIHLMKDNIIEFAYKEQNDSSYLYAKSRNLSGEQDKDWVKIAANYSTKKQKPSYFHTSISYEREGFLVIYEMNVKEDKKLTKDFRLLYYTSNLDLKFEKYIRNVSIDNSDKEKRFNYYWLRVYESGDVYFLSKFKDENSIILNHISSSTNDNVELDDIRSYEIKIDDFAPTTLSFIPNDSSITLVGLYSKKDEKESKTYDEGIYSIKINKDSFFELSRRITPFSKTFKRVFYNSEKGGTGYMPHSINFDTNGRTILIAENTYIEYIKSNYSRLYNYDELMIIVLSENGEILSFRKWDKFSFGGSPTDGKASIYTLSVEKGVYVFYTDHIENFKKKRTRQYVRSSKEGSLAKLFIDYEGNIHVEKLIDYKDLGVMLFPRRMFYRKKYNELVFFGLGKKAIVLGKINLFNK